MGHGMEHGWCGHEHGGRGGHHHGGWSGMGMKMGHHACPMCGMMHGGKGAHAGMEEMLGHRRIVKKAMKEILIEKTKAKLEARWGEKLDAIAQEYVEMAEKHMNMKKEMWKRKQEMKEHLHSIMAEEMGEE